MTFLGWIGALAIGLTLGLLGSGGSIVTVPVLVYVLGEPEKIVLEGLGVGTLTGFVGVGGGFLIVPALVLLGGLPMGRAVGTSLTA